MYFSLTYLNSYVDPSNYTTWRRISQVPPQRAGEGKHILYHITFQKCKKIKKFNLVSTLLNEIYQKCIKIDLFPLFGSTDFFPKRCRQVSGQVAQNILKFSRLAVSINPPHNTSFLLKLIIIVCLQSSNCRGCGGSPSMATKRTRHQLT